jgi:DNA-binding SARP family transcriptional activator
MWGVILMTAEFRVLGNVEALVDGTAVDLGHARQRCVLAVLLVEANDIVRTEELICRAWGARLPLRVRETLYSYLSRLRRALGAADDLSLTRRSGGYVLTVDPELVDLHRFRRLVSAAQATSQDEQATVLFERALRLWRGETFLGLDTPWLNGVRNCLRQERFAAELDSADRLLRRGEHARLMTELTPRVAAHPLDERLAGQLMLALYRSGRQADALQRYQLTRVRLAEEFGADPSLPLQELHRQILTNDPALVAPTASPDVTVDVPAHRNVARR